MAGSGPNSTASAATTAAPVGVTSSTLRSTPYSGAPRSSSSVAGAGSGRRPCALLDQPARRGQRRAGQLVDVEILERQRDAADVADRIQRADLVEVDGLRRDVVHAALGPRERGEHRVRPLERAGGKRGAVEQRTHVRPPAMDVVLLLGEYRHASRREPVTRHRAGLERQSVERQRGQAGLHVVVVRAGIEQGAEQHVAGDAGDGVHVRQAAHAPPPAERAIRAAIVPAPKPSSMLTTATPAAQEVSIASSAERPPKLAP